MQRIKTDVWYVSNGNTLPRIISYCRDNGITLTQTKNFYEKYASRLYINTKHRILNYQCVSKVTEKIIKEEKKMDLLEIYQNEEAEKIVNKVNEDIKKVKQGSEFLKALAEVSADFTQRFPSIDVTFKVSGEGLTPVENEKIACIKLEGDNEMLELHKKVARIRAHLELCDTYEQKETILRAGGIIE